MSTVIVAIIVFGIAGFALYKIIKGDTGGCNGNCSQCHGGCARPVEKSTGKNNPLS